MPLIPVKPRGDQLNQVAMSQTDDGSMPGCIGVGATANRPTGLTAVHVGCYYYDTTLSLPVYWSPALAWKNAAGVAA